MRQMLQMTGLMLAAAVGPAAAQSPDPGVVPYGDMLLFRDGLNLPPDAADGVARDRAGTAWGIYVSSPWPGGTVPVVFESSVSQPHRQLFFESCAAWMPRTGLRCVERTDERTWLVVTERGPSCSATVGAPPRGTGLFNFAEAWCWNSSAVTHDIGHVLGLIHEHQRPDRDTYIEVRTENIQPLYVFAYTRLATGRTLGEYDFDSLMHYPPIGYSQNGQPTIEPRAAYRDRARGMGAAQVPSPLDLDGLAQLYHATPRAPVATPPAAAFTRADFLEAIEDLDRVYMVDLQRPGGLSIGGRPDFAGIAAWIFDVYLASRASGYTVGESFYNVRASISLSDEWRARNPHLTPQPTLPMFSPIQLDRGEYLDAMFRLDEAYRTELLRPDGLSLGGRPDLAGIAAWIFDVYLNGRLSGRAPAEAWADVLAAIRDSDEYRRKHP
jgi:hypothetical protein